MFHNPNSGEKLAKKTLSVPEHAQLGASQRALLHQMAQRAGQTMQFAFRFTNEVHDVIDKKAPGSAQQGGAGGERGNGGAGGGGEHSGQPYYSSGEGSASMGPGAPASSRSFFHNRDPDRVLAWRKAADEARPVLKASGTSRRSVRHTRQGSQAEFLPSEGGPRAGGLSSAKSADDKMPPASPGAQKQRFAPGLRSNHQGAPGHDRHAKTLHVWNADTDHTVHVIQEGQNTPFCPAHEKFHTLVLKLVRNISGAL